MSALVPAGQCGVCKKLFWFVWDQQGKMNMVDDRQLQTQWYRICGRLKAEIGESAFQNWVKPIKFSDFDGTEVNLAVPSRFMRDWVLANYLDRLKELWNGEKILRVNC